MWPFDKRGSGTSGSPKADDWLLAQAERDGFPMIVRMANAYAGLAPLPNYDHHVIVSVQMRDPQPNGFPSTEEGDDLERLELSLSDLLEIDNESLCVLVITNNGLRDFIFYTRNLAGVRERTENAASLFSGFAVGFSAEPDKDWVIYRHFSNWIAGTGNPAEAN